MFFIEDQRFFVKLFDLFVNVMPEMRTYNQSSRLDW